MRSHLFWLAAVSGAIALVSLAISTIAMAAQASGGGTKAASEPTCYIQSYVRMGEKVPVYRINLPITWKDAEDAGLNALANQVTDISAESLGQWIISLRKSLLGLKLGERGGCTRFEFAD